MNLLILGAGGHGKVVEEIAQSTGLFNKIGVLDDMVELAVGKLCDAERLHNEYEAAFVSIGNNALRKELLEKLRQIGFIIPVIVHPTAFVSPSAFVGEGTLVGPMVCVNSSASVGKGCILSIGAKVDHNAVVGDYAHINAGAICMARSRVNACEKIEAGEVVSPV